jgi:AcrB/AcrD/AcrF family
VLALPERARADGRDHVHGGVGTANSILVVSFAKERLIEHGDARGASIEAGTTRFRPVLMTALGMKGGRGLLIVLAGALVLGLAIYIGLHDRRGADAALKRATEEAATATGWLVHPSVSDATDELVLPGNARAFTPTRPSTRGPAATSRS